LSGTMSRGEGCQPAPSSTKRAMRAQRDALADFGQVFVHRLDIDLWHDQRGAGTADMAYR